MTGLVPVRAAAVEALAIDDDVLVFDGEMLHRLTGTAAAAWGLMDGSATVTEIVGELAERYGASEEVVGRDVQALCDQLVEQRVVVLLQEAPGSRHVRPAHVGWVRDGDHVLVGDLAAGTRHALSPTGARVWELACERLSTDEIVAVLREEHPDADVQELDISALLAHLCEAGLLQRRGAPTS